MVFTRAFVAVEERESCGGPVGQPAGLADREHGPCATSADEWSEGTGRARARPLRPDHAAGPRPEMTAAPTPGATRGGRRLLEGLQGGLFFRVNVKQLVQLRDLEDLVNLRVDVAQDQ